MKVFDLFEDQLKVTELLSIELDHPGSTPQAAQQVTGVTNQASGVIRSPFPFLVMK